MFSVTILCEFLAKIVFKNISAFRARQVNLLQKCELRLILEETWAYNIKVVGNQTSKLPGYIIT